MSVEQENLSRVINSPLSAFINEKFVNCPACNLPFTVPDTMFKIVCPNSECKKEILL
jgi:hypothetical protein